MKHTYRAGSLAAIRKGVKVMVRACVLKVSDVERLWTWGSFGGENVGFDFST